MSNFIPFQNFHQTFEKICETAIKKQKFEWQKCSFGVIIDDGGKHSEYLLQKIFFKPSIKWRKYWGVSEVGISLGSCQSILIMIWKCFVLIHCSKYGDSTLINSGFKLTRIAQYNINRAFVYSTDTSFLLPLVNQSLIW